MPYFVFNQWWKLVWNEFQKHSVPPNSLVGALPSSL